MTDKLFSTDAEVAILSILINNPDVIYSLGDLKDFMFSSTPNQVLFRSIIDLSTSGSVPEYNLLLSTLKSKGNLEDCGGEGYLKYLIAQTYEVQGLKDFERIVINSYKARSVIQITNNVAGRIKGVDNVDEVISGIKASLDSLTVVGGGETTSKISDDVKDVWEDIKTKVEHPNTLRGVSTGFRTIDAVTGGYNQGDIVILAGRPSQGKTALLCNSVLKSQATSLVFSLEMPKKSLIERFLSIKTGVSISDIRFGTVNSNQISQLKDAILEIKDYPIFIDSNFSGDLSYIVSTVRKYKKLYDVQVVYIDYIQLLAERTMNATNELGQISRQMKMLSNELGIATVILSQLNRSVELRDDKRPILSDLRQSGNLEEDADLVAMLYRDEYYNENPKNKGKLEFIIRKHRNGSIGTLFFDFEKESNNITE